MKKVILGFVSVSCAGLLFYGLQGSHLAAQEEIATSEETAISATQETSVASEAIPSSEEATPVTPEVTDEPSMPSSEEPAVPETSTSEEVSGATEESSEAETSTTETGSSTMEETTAPTEETTEVTESTTETTESTTGTTESTIESTTESTTEETTSSSSSTASSSTESSTNSSSAATESSSTTASSSKPTESKKPETNVPVAKPAPSVNPGPALSKPAGPTLDPNYVPQLSEDLEAAKLQPSNLAGYELPLLSDFSDKRQATLVYAGIQMLGAKQEDDFVTDTFAQQLWKEMFDRDLATLEALDIKKADLLPGDLLYRVTETGTETLGVVLDGTHYLTVEKVKVEDEKLEKKEKLATEEVVNEEKPEEVQEEMQVVAKPLALADEDHLQVKRETEHALTEEGNKVLASYPADQPFKANPITQDFIDSIGDSARDLGLKYDVFASVMIAQAILESGSGSSGLSSAPNYNLFGVKGSYQGSYVEFATQEDRGNGELYTINAAFRRYPNYTASLGDYVELIRGGISGNDSFYKDVWRTEAKNYLLATHSLTGKYATDTLYHKKLNSLIAVYNLTQFDQPKSETGFFIKGKNEIPAEYAALMKYPDYNGINYNTSGSYPVGQCTWYAFNRTAQLGGKVDNFMGNGGEWGTKGSALGYKVTQVPEAGTLISFKPGVAGSSEEYGHVAFVEAVGPNGILISEGNVYGGTIISYRVIPNDLAYSNLVSYVTPK